MTNFIECNTLDIFIQFSETALFLVEISQPAPRNPTKCCIIARQSTAFTGRNGIMETGSPHYQQTFQHKWGAINDVMLTLLDFPIFRCCSSLRAQVYGKAASCRAFALPAPKPAAVRSVFCKCTKPREQNAPGAGVLAFAVSSASVTGR